MHRIESARFKPGVTAADLPRPSTGVETGAAERVIRGKALIFWDPSVPGKKRDAIDTDQITPAADCVSESLETLDERWKAGSFRYLMPDFRERVHRGETFLIAGDRFAIGSSREMSPAGLKGVAEEAGLELVVVCGANMGDIFRRNAFNLGLHVVQSPEAVADARDGDTLTFDTRTRRLTNETQAKSYEPVPLSEKEEEIRRSGGIFAVGRRELRKSLERAPEIRWPDPRDRAAHDVNRADRLGASRRQGRRGAARDDAAGLRGPAPRLRRDGSVRHPHVQSDHRRRNDLPEAGGHRQRSLRLHRKGSGREADLHRQGVRAPQRNREAVLRDSRRRHLPLLFSGAGSRPAGQFIPGADSHSRAYGAYGAVGFGVGSTTLGFGWATGYVYFTLAKQRRVVFRGRLQPWVSGKDIVLELLRRWGAKQSQGMSVEFVDEDRQLPIAYRNTIANMMAEGEAQNGIFAQDEITEKWYREKGITDLPYPRVTPGAEAAYEIDEEFVLSEVVPMIAKPFSPGNAFAAEEVARERLTFDKALIGSCTNGSYDDLLQAALVLRAAREKGFRRAAGTFTIFPGSGGVGRQIEAADPRLGGDSIAEVFRSAGGEIRMSWCGPCFGQGPDALKQGRARDHVLQPQLAEPHGTGR